MKRTIIWLLLVSILMTGCINKHILDDIRIVTAVGMDPADNGMIEISVVVPRYNPDKSTTSETFTQLTSLGRFSKEQLSMSESKPFVTGKIEVISVSQEIAQNGIMPLTDGFIRDPSVGSRVFLFVAENTANELLQGQYSSQDNGMFISDMLAQNVERGPLPNTNIHLFFNQFYDKGSDPFLPLLGLRNNKIKILGLALLKDDKMAGKIGLKDLFAFKTLQEKNTKGDHYLVKLDDGNEVYLNKISSKWKVNMTNLETSPKVEYDVNLNLAIREFSGDKLDQARIKKIKDKIEEQFKQEAEEMIQYFQELKVDPLGIGSLARSRLRSWNKEKWQDQYPNIEVVVNSKVKISETGIAE